MVEVVDTLALTVRGRLFRIAVPRDEPYECIQDPQRFLEEMRRRRIRADLLTFMQDVSETARRHNFHCQMDALAVLPVTSYEHWLKSQIDFKARNKTRKAAKNGVEIRIVEFNDALIQGVSGIFNESPMRQGKPFKHYGKDHETLRRDLGTFLERSTFVGAFHSGKLIGFIKFVEGRNVASLMQITSTIADRDKAPTNALVAKAVEMCAERRISYLHYGIWSKRGLGEFKVANGFVRHEVPRYYIPLTARGRVMLKLGLHEKLEHYIPEPWMERLLALRGKWTNFRYQRLRENGDVPKPALPD